jgi:hypothetical protein
MEKVLSLSVDSGARRRTWVLVGSGVNKTQNGAIRKTGGPAPPHHKQAIPTGSYIKRRGIFAALIPD